MSLLLVPTGAPPVEEEFGTKEKELTDAVIKVIAMAKKETIEITTESTKANIVEACKTAASFTFEFQALMKECKRPYIAHSNQLFQALNKIEHGLLNIEDAVVSAKSGASTENAEQIVKELHNSRVSASKVTSRFRSWLLTNPACYIFATDKITDLQVTDPVDPALIKTEMLRCPRWLLRQLIEARQSQSRTLEMQMQLQDELNQYKVKVNTAEQSSREKYQQEIQQKDEQIRKLNLQLKELYKDVSNKGPVQSGTQFKSVEEKLGKLAEAAALKDEEIKKLKQSNDKDQAEVKRLRVEAVKLKMLLQNAELQRQQLEQQLLNTKQGDNIEQQLSALDQLSELAKNAGQQQQPQQPQQPQQNPSEGPKTPVLKGVSSTDEIPTAVGIFSGEEEDEGLEEIPFNEARVWLTEEQKRVAYSKVFLNGFNFVDLFGKTLTRQTGDESAAALLDLFEQKEKTFELLTYAIQAEVNKTKDPATLFRSEELPSRLIRVFQKKVAADYLKQTLGPFIETVAKSNMLLEVDPNRLNNPTLLKENFDKLESLTQQFLDGIFDSVSFVPKDLSHVCKILCQAVGEKFPGKEDVAAAGFIFLRLLCPAVASPESAGIIPEPVQTNAQRTLLLVGKLLQNLANQAPFKEPYLQDMNRFLDRNSDEALTFFDRVRTFPPEVDGASQCLDTLIKTTIISRPRLNELMKGSTTLSAALYKQKITAVLGDRVRSVLKSFGAVSETPSGPPSGTPNPNRKRSDEPQPAKKVITITPCTGKDDPKAQSFVRTLMDNQEVVETIISLTSSEKEASSLRPLGDWLSTIFHANDQVEFLFKVAVQAEANYPTHTFLHQSVSKSVFTSYCTKFCNNWSRLVLGEIVNNIVTQNIYLEIDPVKLDPAYKSTFNREENLQKLKKLTTAVLDTLLNNLNSAPRSLWLFANTLADNTSQDVFQFLCVNFFSQCLEHPHLYGVTNDKPKREPQRTLTLLSDILRNYANKSRFWIEQQPITESDINSIIQQTERWARSPSSATSKAPEPMWLQEKQSIESLVEWMAGRAEEIVSQLDTVATKHISQLLDSVKPDLDRPLTVAAAAAPEPTSKDKKGKDKKDKKDKKEDKDKKDKDKKK